MRIVDPSEDSGGLKFFTERGCAVLIFALAGVLGLLAGCSANEETVEQRPAESLALPLQVAEWPVEALVVTNSIQLDQRGVFTGDVAVTRASPGPVLAQGAELALGIDARLVGNVRADTINLGLRAVLAGNAHYNGALGGTIEGTRTTPLSLPLALVLPTLPSTTPGSSAVTLASNVNLTLAPGNYAAATLAQGNNGQVTKLTLSGGPYRFSALTLGTDARVECAAACEVRVDGRVAIGARSYVGPGNVTGVGAGNVQLLVRGSNGASGPAGLPAAVSVGNDGTLRAYLFAPNGTVRSGERVDLRGKVVAKDAFVGIDTAGRGLQLPRISQQPRNAVVFVGQLAEFRVTAAGPGITYRWQKNGATIAGETTATLRIANASLADDGAQYAVILSNEAGTVTSSLVTLDVVPCDDGNACTADQCIDPVLGAVHTPMPSGSACALPAAGTEVCNATATCVAAPVPFVSCVDHIGGGKLSARFGYDNPSSQQLIVPAGPNNLLASSGQTLNGQVTTFGPNRTEGAFRKQFSVNQSLTWSIAGTSVTANGSMGPCAVKPARQAIAAHGEGARGYSSHVGPLRPYVPVPTPVAPFGNAASVLFASGPSVQPAAPGPNLFTVQSEAHPLPPPYEGPPPGPPPAAGTTRINVFVTRNTWGGSFDWPCDDGADVGLGVAVNDEHELNSYLGSCDTGSCPPDSRNSWVGGANLFTSSDPAVIHLRVYDIDRSGCDDGEGFGDGDDPIFEVTEIASLDQDHTRTVTHGNEDSITLTFRIEVIVGFVPADCGDGYCEGVETCSSCEVDCDACPPPACGDAACNGDETCGTCPADCGACPEPVCGDSACNGSETCSTCELDCAACPPPPPPAVVTMCFAWDTDYIEDHAPGAVASGPQPASFAEYHLYVNGPAQRATGIPFEVGAKYLDDGTLDPMTVISPACNALGQCFLDETGCVPTTVMADPSWLVHKPGDALNGLDLAFELRANFERKQGSVSQRFIVRRALLGRDADSYPIGSTAGLPTLHVAVTTAPGGNFPIGQFTEQDGWLVPPSVISVVSPGLEAVTEAAAFVSRVLAHPDNGLSVDGMLVGVPQPRADASGAALPDEPLPLVVGAGLVLPVTPDTAMVACTTDAQCTAASGWDTKCLMGECSCVIDADCRNGRQCVVNAVAATGLRCGVTLSDSAYQGFVPGTTQPTDPVPEILFIGGATLPLDANNCTTNADCSEPGQACINADGSECTASSCQCRWQDQARWKFINMHEFGHLVHANVFGDSSLPSYGFQCDTGATCTGSYDSFFSMYNDPPGANVQCGCDQVTAANRLHCLQSVETTHDAVTEGFAQFFASALYNDPVTEGGVSSAEPCTFWYYKEGLLDACPDEALYDCTPFGDKVKVMPPFPVACGAADQWRDQVCGGAATTQNPVLADMSTERDWMQFLFNWNRRGPNNSSMYEIQQAQGQMCNPMSCVDANGRRMDGCQTPLCGTIMGELPNEDWSEPGDVMASLGAVRFVWALRPSPPHPAGATYPDAAFTDWQVAHNRWSEERSMRLGADQYFVPMAAAGDPTALNRRDHFLEMARTRGVDQDTTVVPP